MFIIFRTKATILIINATIAIVFEFISIIDIMSTAKQGSFEPCFASYYLWKRFSKEFNNWIMAVIKVITANSFS